MSSGMCIGALRSPPTWSVPWHDTLSQSSQGLAEQMGQIRPPEGTALVRALAAGGGWVNRVHRPSLHTLAREAAARWGW